MKIAIYSPVWPARTESNGIVTYTSHIVPALRSLGHEVYILTSQSSNPADKFTIDLRQFDEKPSFWQRLLFRIFASSAQYQRDSQRLVRGVSCSIKRYAIEVLEIEETFGLSKAISDLDALAVVVRLHGPWFINRNTKKPSRKDLQREMREVAAIEGADLVTGPSKFVIEQTVNRYSLRRREVFSYLPNPIEIPAVQWRLSECDMNNLLFVGRFDAVKGGDLVIQAFGKLASSYPDLTLTFIGPDKGVKSDGGSWISCQTYARSVLSENALARFTFMGPVPPIELLSYRRRSFVTLFASCVEIFGYTAAEAMALGCPLVASGVGGVAELVEHGKSGLLFSAGDIDGFVSSVETMLNDPAMAVELGKNARLRAALYSPEDAAVLAVELYKRAIRQRKP